ncbi:hypothetical protein [Erythrobacter sp.]|uniref:hypothetical protein n=1 Tax=Erythrobacter sp. TaxID=1042 RepID=UPI0025D8A45A|nr:hypothetical protein [Erythrobacter sp.]
MTMLPGYGTVPYVTPIRVDALSPLGNRRFELVFLNLGYAAGVQGFQSTFRTLKRGPGFLMAEQESMPERGYLFQNLTRDWLDKNIGSGSGDRYLHDDESPNEQRLLEAAATAC